MAAQVAGDLKMVIRAIHLLNNECTTSMKRGMQKKVDLTGVSNTVFMP